VWAVAVGSSRGLLRASLRRPAGRCSPSDTSAGGSTRPFRARQTSILTHALLRRASTLLGRWQPNSSLHASPSASALRSVLALWLRLHSSFSRLLNLPCGHSFIVIAPPGATFGLPWHDSRALQPSLSAPAAATEGAASFLGSSAIAVVSSARLTTALSQERQQTRP
jgi:hypothetical protein